MMQMSQRIVIYAGLVALIVIIGVVFVGFTSPLNKSMQRERIYTEPINDYIRISDMEPNSMVWFNYPNGQDTKNIDTYQKFILIRLPAELGGNKDDTSAFRAYSALDINSHCVMKYWPQEGRKRIEDPCSGDMIYPQYGFIGVNTNPINTGVFVAQPYLELSSDLYGYLYVEPPIFDMDKNGVIGIGRKIDQDYVKNLAIQDFEKYTKNTGHDLKIPYELTDGTIITPLEGSGSYIFRHPQDARIIHTVQVTYCHCVERISSGGWHGSQEFHSWSLGEEKIHTDQWFNQKGDNYYSEVEIYRNGYEILISGTTLEKTLDLVFDNFYPGKNRSMLVEYTSSK